MNHESLCISINHNIIALREHSFYLKTKEKKNTTRKKNLLYSQQITNYSNYQRYLFYLKKNNNNNKTQGRTYTICTHNKSKKSSLQLLQDRG